MRFKWIIEEVTRIPKAVRDAVESWRNPQSEVAIGIAIALTTMLWAVTPLAPIIQSIAVIAQGVAGILVVMHGTREWRLQELRGDNI